MPSMQQRSRYNVVIGEQSYSLVTAIIRVVCSRQRWHARTEQEVLEEQVARELFPSISGTYQVPAFVLKPEDTTDNERD